MKNKIEYKTPSGRLCPYPDMTDMELDDFERWAEEIEKTHKIGKWDILTFLVILLLIGDSFWRSG